jgi:hypothetical protein
MHIFKEKIVFTAWGELYAGLKREWINVSDVFEFCHSGKVKCCDENRLVSLYLAYDESLYSFYELVKDFIEVDNAPIIVKNEDESERDFKYIPEAYWKIWQLEFMLRVKANSNTIEEKLEEIVKYYYIFDFPEEWTMFINFQPPICVNQIFGADQVYLTFISYVEKVKMNFKN